MAEYCPKCNYKFKPTDWRPECPQCGVNVLYYGVEDRLRAEADKAELEHAHMQPRFDRLKASLIGHPLSIVRLALGLLPIVATLIPSGQIRYVLPFGTQTKEAGLIGVINFLTGADLDTGLLSRLWGSQLVGKGLVLWTVALLSFLLMLVVTLVGFFLLTLSCSPKGFRRNIAFPVTGMALATVSFVSYAMMVKTLTAELPGIFSGTVAPWAYILVMLLFAAMIAVNVIYKKKNIPVKYKDVSELLLPYHERPSVIAKEKEKQEKAEAPAAAE